MSPNEKLSWIVLLVDDILAKLTANLAKKVHLIDDNSGSLPEQIGRLGLQFQGSRNAHN